MNTRPRKSVAAVDVYQRQNPEWFEQFWHRAAQIRQEEPAREAARLHRVKGHTCEPGEMLTSCKACELEEWAKAREYDKAYGITPDPEKDAARRARRHALSLREEAWA